MRNPAFICFGIQNLDDGVQNPIFLKNPQLKNLQSGIQAGESHMGNHESTTQNLCGGIRNPKNS